ncbi:MAG TPA: hypothetical protein VI669_18500 [Vicinamibacteria bacterium]
MSKLKDLVSRGVRLIVADTEEGTAPDASAPEDREVPAEAFEEGPPKRVTRSEVSADVADFGAVYEEAGIELPLHGYGVDKVAEMLSNKRLATLQREVKATAVLAALEAASVPIREVIQDAVVRDKALDAFEAAKAQEIRELQAQSGARIEAIKNEIEAFLKEKNAEMEGLKQAKDAAERAFQALQARKRQEEQRLFDLVAHFLEGGDNPITAQSPMSPPPPAKTAPDQA